MREGTFSMNMNIGFLAWALNLALGRSIRIFQVQDLIYSSYTLKYFYWKAMGANIKYGINSSMYVNMIDLPLISIGSGSMIGDDVQISCHIMFDGRLYLKKVTIGENSSVGVKCQIGPGTKIGNNCEIAPWNILARRKIKDNEKIKIFQFFQKLEKE
jgi:acetyltransferase-like isoleucine patch superfamily enzyme